MVTGLNIAQVYSLSPRQDTTMITAVLISVITLLVLIIYRLATRKFNYWKTKNVPYPEPIPIFGNYKDFILTKEYIGKTVQKLCKKFPNEPYFGAFFGTEPVLIVQDPAVIKLILIKDYSYFCGREISAYYHRETITESLFFSSGDRWKVMRQNLSPLFSILKLKSMFHLIQKCSDMLELMLEEELKVSEVAEARSLMTRYAMDCICSTTFGVDTNTMQDSRDNPFRIMGDLIFEISTYRAFKSTARAIWPGIFYGVGLKNFPEEIKVFFNKLMKGVFKERRGKPSPRNDFVDLILAMKTGGRLNLTGDSIKGDKKVQLEMNDDLIVASVVGLFAAGFETSSTALSMGLYELAKNEEAQEKAFQEIVGYLKTTDGKITYECIKQLPFIDACMEETVRLYPSLGVITREVMEDYTLPNGLKLEKDLRVHLPIYHLNHNPDFFEDPEVFRPERLMGEEKAKVKPYTFMPFGEGPRICIGLRLAKMQVIPGFVAVLRRYRVTLTEGTPTSLPLEPKATVTQPIGGVRLRFIRRENAV